MGKWIEMSVLLQCHFLANRLKVYCLFLVLTFSVNACIEPYEAEIEEETELISIEGSIIKGDSLQHIVITTTTPLINPEFKPVRGCDVKVVDEFNNEFIFKENEKGTYSSAIANNLLVSNRQYKLIISTPNGDKYESLYETLNSSAAVDTVYYDIENKIETFTGEETEGIQFYIDIEAPDTISRYFRWNLTESYEYTTTGPISYIYRIKDGELVKDTPADIWAVYRCWISEKIPRIFLANTINLTINKKKKIPLHYVSTKTDRLKIKYTLLVNQYTMNERAYNYWQQNKIATEESGGLYTRQPGQALTNLYSVNDSTEKVLGFFWVSSRTEHRIFIPRINNLVVYDIKCEIYEFDPDIHKRLPRYIRVDESTGKEMTGHPNCFDCTLRGGTITKPDFWE